MKRLFPLLLLTALVVCGCQKDPDTDKLEDQYLVYTSYDSSAQFSSFTTFYVADSIALANNDTTKVSYWKSPLTAPIRNAFGSKLTACGYTAATAPTGADLGLQLTYIPTTYIFNDYYDSPWWGGYWSPSYWGWYGNWYYPYAFAYQISTGTLIAELVDVAHARSSSSSNVTVVWTCSVGGLLGAGGNPVESYLLNGIAQAFNQSPYLSN